MSWLLLLLFAADQPLPFSHKTHAETALLKCAECHTMPAPGEQATIPETKKCMSCHIAVKKESPHIQKLTEFHTAKKPVPWIRVYQIPGFVFFSHKVHTDAGAKCETCHGPVAEREVLKREVETNMGACMTCHQKNKASNDCATCHEKMN